MKRPPDPSVYVILVNWNGKSDTVRAIDSLVKLRRNRVKVVVVVVDNGSTDDSVVEIKRMYREVHVIETGSNLGFTGGNNIGIRYALSQGSTYIWLLNNDTIVDPNALQFLDVLRDPSVGAVGSKIYFAKGHEYHTDRYTQKERGRVLWYAGGLIDWDNMYASHRGVDEVDRGQYDTSEETQFITGCSLCVKASVVQKIGMLDERYYLYLEDVDWNLRIRRANFKIMYVPSSRLWHVNAGSSGRPGNPLHEYYFTRNRLLLGFRYASLRTKLALFREAVRFVFLGTPIRRKAVLDAFLGKFGKQYEPKRD